MLSLSVTGLITDLIKAFMETFLMCGISIFISIVLGLPLGLFIYITREGLFWQNRILHLIGGLLVNIVRSTPFVILLVLLIPVTHMLTGTTIGPLAASVPLSVAAVAFYARLVEGSLVEVDKGVLEAATAMGATNGRIIREVLLVEALPGLLRGLTVTVVSLVGYTAMAGIVGGGGVGDLAIRFGYYRYETNVMIITVVLLIVLVQVIQSLGELIAGETDKR
ncbi:MULTISPECIES: methionine ABC transporter permease [Paenibacillus]|uniref:ABC transporter permease n=1 Tax=Paenibacillus rhizophilus TaxID=1850366 RepID=A0A3N9PDS8_9BACL|nr:MULTISPECIES: methionine ABC transporter permease [Paenibacillus]RQW13710.1 ABC transporter permease [Paenibacillus rhizophilus]BCG59109.1 ABC transporter permease [Paenibacillus sp. URB8-2]